MTAPADTARAMHAAEMRGQDMQDAELVAQLRGRHRFCIDRGEIKTPELLCESADRIEALAAELAECQRRIDAVVTAEIANASVMFEQTVADLVKALKSADTYIDKGHYEMARNITRNAIRARGQK